MPSFTRPLLASLTALVVAVPLVIASGFAAAQAYPTKVVRMVTGYAPGGTSDILARLVAQELSKSLGQQFIVENKPGAGGNIGSDFVAKSAPDGYTLLMGASGPLAFNRSLYPRMPYDPLKDLAPIAMVASVPLVLVVHPSIPAHSVRELIDFCRKNARDCSYASAGNGTPQHLSAELFKSIVGNLDMVHVPYKGTGPAITDLLGGQVKVAFETTIAVLQHVKGGKMRALAVTSAKRSSTLPEVPTMQEAGVPGYESVAWYGMAAPAGTPREIVAKLNAETNKVLNSPEVGKRLADLGSDPVSGSPEQFAAWIRNESDKWAKIIKAANITLE
jgi:tripartite-type tricarboxylate transporter receptor subunit TctC